MGPKIIQKTLPLIICMGLLYSFNEISRKLYLVCINRHFYCIYGTLSIWLNRELIFRNNVFNEWLKWRRGRKFSIHYNVFVFAIKICYIGKLFLIILGSTVYFDFWIETAGHILRSTSKIRNEVSSILCYWSSFISKFKYGKFEALITICIWIATEGIIASPDIGRNFSLQDRLLRSSILS